MLFLFTDFGTADVYAGQVHARLRRALDCTLPIVDLLHSAPAFNVRASAHLLAALSARFEPGDICVAVVDPGVGGARDAIAMQADDCWYVGPDNGLLSVVAGRSRQVSMFSIAADEGEVSASFHGRDVFAPAAARLARGDSSALLPKARLDVDFDAEDLAEIIYLDHYGNAMSGLRAANLAVERELHVAGCAIAHARVFGAAALAQPFWYANSIGLAEIACNQASAVERLGLRVGLSVEVR